MGSFAYQNRGYANQHYLMLKLCHLCWVALLKSNPTRVKQYSILIFI